MTHAIEAIYENGVLRPLEPLPLPEHQRVSVVVSNLAGQPRRAYRDMAYLESVKKEVAAMGEIPSLEEIRRMTSTDQSSWADAVSAEREERF